MKAIEFAIQMELDGQKYYLEQAELNKDNELKGIFELLAEEEHKHARMLEQYGKTIEINYVQSQAYGEFKNVFTDLEDFSVKILPSPSQLEVFRYAVEREQESIDLYKKLKDEAEVEEEKTLFAFLVREEEEHLRIFQDLVEHLIKAEQWVEDAEFGLRKEEY